MTPADIIALLNLKPHPEGGWYAETHRSEPPPLGHRAAGTAIYYLLEAGQRSHWHRVDADETWHVYAGAPLALSIHADGQTVGHTLGADLSSGQRPQCVVPAHAWQAAESLGAWTLCGCTVAPGFEFAGFEMAAEGWSPE